MQKLFLLEHDAMLAVAAVTIAAAAVAEWCC